MGRAKWTSNAIDAMMTGPVFGAAPEPGRQASNNRGTRRSSDKKRAGQGGREKELKTGHLLFFFLVLCLRQVPVTGTRGGRLGAHGGRPQSKRGPDCGTCPILSGLQWLRGTLRNGLWTAFGPRLAVYRAAGWDVGCFWFLFERVHSERPLYKWC